MKLKNAILAVALLGSWPLLGVVLEDKDARYVLGKEAGTIKVDDFNNKSDGQQFVNARLSPAQKLSKNAIVVHNKKYWVVAYIDGENAKLFYPTTVMAGESISVESDGSGVQVLNPKFSIRPGGLLEGQLPVSRAGTYWEDY